MANNILSFSLKMPTIKKHLNNLSKGESKKKKAVCWWNPLVCTNSHPSYLEILNILRHLTYCTNTQT
jgi:hypothetical protein